MSNQRLSLQLAEQILALFADCGATQLEQYAALDVVRALVPTSDASLVTPSAEPPPTSAAAV